MRDGINTVSTVMEIERDLGPRRSSSGTLIRECLVDTAHMVVAQYLGTAGPRVSCKGIETRMLVRVSFPLSGAELSRSMVMRTCNKSEGPG